jgi:hypothetical protein
MTACTTLTEARSMWKQHRENLRLSETIQIPEVSRVYAEMANNYRTEYDRIMLARSRHRTRAARVDRFLTKNAEKIRDYVDRPDVRAKLQEVE